MIKKIERKVEVDGKEVEIYVTRPSNAIARQAEIFRIKQFNKHIADGLLTRRQCKLQMKKLGEWTDKEEAEELRINWEIQNLEKQLYRGDGNSKPKLSEGKNIAIKIRQLRAELRDFISAKMAVEANSAENIADDEKFDFLVAHCTFYKENHKKVYNSFEAYNERSADNLAYVAASALAQLMYNITDDFEEQLPENKFLVKFGLVNEDLSLIDPNNGKTVDLEGKRIDDEGYYLNEEGERVDSEGNKIEENGLYELVEYENDLVESKPKKRTRTTNKKTSDSK